MIESIKADVRENMEKSIVALDNAFKRIRTGRATPSILDSVKVVSYGAEMPISQVANIAVEDGRALAITPWEKPMVGEIEKAILKSNIGLNPNTNGDTIRLVMPALTEETRRDYIKVAKAEAEKGRVSIRNARKSANDDIKTLLKDKDISEDEARGGEDQIQKITNEYIEVVEKHLAQKEKALLEV